MTASKDSADVASRRRRLPTGIALPTFRLTRNLLGGGVLLMALAGWSIGYRSTQRMAESAELAALSQDVIVAVRGVSVALRQAAAAVRSAHAHADNGRLDDYRTAAMAYRKEMATLRRLLGDEPGQLARLDALERIVTPHLDLLDAAAAGTAPLPPNEPPDEPVAAAVEGLLGELETREQALAEERARDARARAQGAILVQTFNALLAVLTIFGAFVLFNRDVTRQQRDDARLREAVKDADAANEAKTHFLAMVSHEIRTPLNAVSGMSELLLDTRLAPEQAEFARAVHSNAEALSMLIGDLLDSSRIEAHQLFLDPAPFDLRELVEGVAELLALRAEARGVAFIVDVPPGTPRGLVGDRARLRQVLMNLVGNAVKFTERGDVTIRARVEPAVEGPVHLSLAVIDTGIGIPLEAQARIFERFVQADRATARTYGGTGLGLNISRSLIELMGGRLSVQSEPGRGSTFEAALTLPLAPTQPPPDFGPASLAGVDVLLVQQNAALRAMNESLLRYAGASVRAVETAAEASSEIARLAPQVIALEERLPDSHGIELAKRIWSDRHGSTPAVSIVLMCSLRAMPARHIGSHGITTCIYKPVKQARLIQAVRQAAGLAPVAVDREPDDVATLAPAPAVHPRILLVEDNAEDRAQATQILSGNGYEVDHAGTGLEALSCASTCDYDLVLMGVELPQIDGLEATRRIRAREADTGQRVPIVGLTAHVIDGFRRQALAAGMNDCANGPLERQQLLDICEKWIDRRPLLVIADDAPDNMLLLSSYLRGDYRLASAANGREAVEAVERRRPSLVLLDMNMPVMDGYEAARTIRRLPGGDAVPIVALTSHDGPRERERCLAAGCTDFLSKPVRRADLRARVNALLGRPASSGSSRDHAESDATPPSPRLDPASLPAATAASADTCDDVVVDEDIVDLVPGYIAARRQDMTTLRDYLERRDLASIAALAHKMKGSGAGYGLPDVTRLGRDIEAAARSGDSTAVKSLIDDLEGRLARARIRSANERMSTEL
jgi:two-component system, sensor histidine kinase and response regulator